MYFFVFGLEIDELFLINKFVLFTLEQKYLEKVKPLIYFSNNFYYFSDYFINGYDNIRN